MPVQSHVRAVALLDLPAVALDAGVEPYSAMQKAGINADTLQLPHLTFPADKVAWLLDDLAARSGKADFSIRLAMRRRLANLGVIGLILGQQPTVRDALAMTQRYRHLMTDAMSIHLETEGDVSTLIIGTSLGKPAPVRQMRELALATYIHLFRLLLGENWSPNSVHFAHSAPNGNTLHRRFFGCPVEFESSFDGLQCASSDLDRINTNADEAIAGYAASLLDALPSKRGNETTSLVIRLVHALLPMGRASISNVARAMARSVRKLQRDLASEGVEFSKLVSEVRTELALEMLMNGSQSIREISERLGYSHPAAFIRFFRGQFKVPPAAWARHQK